MLFLLLFAQTVLSMNHTSLTIDEGLHITSGYSILRTGDYRLIEEHPPLIKFLIAAPLLLVPDLPNPSTLPGWEMDVPLTDSLRLVRVTEGLIYDYRPLDRLVFAARLPVAALALLLGALVFRWAADLFGPRAGLLALAILTFDPNIVAHAGVAATDLGAACFILLALFTFQRFLEWPTLGRWALAGLALGLAQGTKLSALLLLPTQGILLLVYGWHRRSSDSTPVQLLKLSTLPRRWRIWVNLGVAYAGMLALAAVVLWGLYGFKVGPVPGLDIPLPAASHAIPWLRLREHIAGGHAAFLMGKISHHGWWYYFPVALALKTPLPILCAWVAACLALALGLRRRWRRELALFAFVLLYLGLSIQSNLNIGYRHLLPILPLMAILAGRLAHILRYRLFQLAAAGLSLWLITGTLSISPHYLAYFNELAGGPDGGYRYMVDSNTDWGQALKALADYQDTQDIDSVYLSMFTFLDPSIYGVHYEPLTPMHGDTPAVFPSRFNPPPGVYVISSTTLQGIPLADPEMFDWFRHRAPDARIGHVMFVYHVPEPQAPGRWVAQCTSPVAPLPAEVLAEGLGDPDLRRAYFDCTQSWLFPQGGESAGWYVLSREAARQSDAVIDFIETYLTPARLSYEQTQSHAVPPFVIYEWPPMEGRLWAELTTTGLLAPSAWPPAQVETEGTQATAPLTLERPVLSMVEGPVLSNKGRLEWLGYRLPETTLHSGQTVALETVWRVKQPPDAPLSLMAHLIAADGHAVAVGDGLGVPFEIWQAGDVIVQRHNLAVPPDTRPGTYWLQIGAYTLADLQRWVVHSDQGPAADRILLKRIEVVK